MALQTQQPGDGRRLARGRYRMCFDALARHPVSGPECVNIRTFELLVGDAWFTVKPRVYPKTDRQRLFAHRTDGAVRVLAAALVAAMAFAQFAASWHEISVRHVQCAEHGEAIDVGVVSHLGPSRASNRADGTWMEGADSGEAASHDHCSVLFALRAGSRAQLVRLATRFEPPPVVVRPASEPAPRPGRAFVLASAPKTSPPAA